MKKWLRRIRGAVGMGLAWAIGWALVGGGVMEGIVDPHGKILDMWPQTLGMIGFFGGVAFATVLGIAGGRRRFDELSLPRFAAWGAVAGLLLGVLGVAMGAGPVFIGVTTLGSAIAASGTLALARMAQERGSLDAGADVAEVGLTEAEKQQLLGGRG